MKFALALVAVVSADQLPTVSWDDKAVKEGANIMHQYGHQAKALDKANAKANAKDLARAFATFETQVGVNYAKFVKPYEKAKVAWLDMITVDGKCNTEAASQCIYKTYGLDGPKQNPQACLKKANCQTNWDKLTPVQKKAAVAKYQAWKKRQDAVSHQTMHKIGNAVDVKLQQAMRNAKARDLRAQKLWQTAMIKFAKTMHCNVPCANKCGAMRPEQTVPCLEKCAGCFKNIVNIKHAGKAAGPHKLEAIEEVFGPVENMADHEWENISETFNMIEA